MGIDEKSFRKTENTEALLDTLRENQRDAVEAVAMDMCPAFEAEVRENLPQAEIVYDKFHISDCLNKAVDGVRKRELQELMAKGKDALKGTQYQWLRNFQDLRSQPGFRALYSVILMSMRVWRLKESFAGFWDCRYQEAAETFFAEWHNQVRRSPLEPMRKVPEMLPNRFEAALNYFKHSMTNAASEAMNSMVARVVGNARGRRTFATFRIRVLFFLGKLDLSIV